MTAQTTTREAPFSQPEAQLPKRKGWKEIVSFIVALIAWAAYYFLTWAPSPPATQAELARPAGSVLAIKPQEPSAKPREMAETFVENIGNTTIAANELTMLARLRTVNTAQATYNATYDHGFAPSLAALTQADLIDSAIASGRIDGYTFYYKPVSLAGQTIGYWVWTRPSVYNRNSIASCITNETLDIHCTNEDRYAAWSDPLQ
jgi:hypothetical protein